MHINACPNHHHDALTLIQINIHLLPTGTSTKPTTHNSTKQVTLHPHQPPPSLLLFGNVQKEQGQRQDDNDDDYYPHNVHFVPKYLPLLVHEPYMPSLLLLLWLLLLLFCCCCKCWSPRQDDDDDAAFGSLTIGEGLKVGIGGGIPETGAEAAQEA